MDEIGRGELGIPKLLPIVIIVVYLPILGGLLRRRHRHYSGKLTAVHRDMRGELRLEDDLEMT